MTAGKGIAHSERFEDPAALKGGNLEMIQTWVALPENDEELNPTFQNYAPDQLSHLYRQRSLDATHCRGCLWSQEEVKTNSPLFYLHVLLEQGATFGLPKEHSERGYLYC